jgi:two-component system NtrC family sensor kinase
MSSNRVLIIDDEEIVRDSIRGILRPNNLDESELEDAAMGLFEEEPLVVKKAPRSFAPDFEVVEASNGINGLEKVKASMLIGTPFQVIFLDMRMPGWDGLRTCVEIRKIDPKVQIYFVTAYADHTINEIIEEAGHDVGYISKPFMAEEILQLGTKAIYDWHKLTNLERLLKIIGEIGFGATELNTLLVNILHQIADYIKSDYALLGRFNLDSSFNTVAKIGIGDNRIDIDALFGKLDVQHLNKITLYNGVLICPMEHFCIIAVTSSDEHFNQEKLYLVELFVENAVRAVKNSELQKQLIQNERLSAVGQAISMVMHDIRNPISQIDGIAQMIQEDPGNEEMNTDLSQLMLASTKSAYDIIHDVLDFTKDASVNLSSVNLNDYLGKTIEESKKRLSLDFEEKVKIVLEMDANEDFEVRLDERKIDRVIINLINNAVEALTSKSIENAKITINAFADDNYFKIRIKDNGPGIPEEIKENLFKPFVTKNKTEGTGLGLAIVKQIIESHDGHIDLEPTEGGASFIIRLPNV